MLRRSSGENRGNGISSSSPLGVSASARSRARQTAAWPASLPTTRAAASRAPRQPARPVRPAMIAGRWPRRAASDHGGGEPPPPTPRAGTPARPGWPPLVRPPSARAAVVPLRAHGLQVGEVRPGPSYCRQPARPAGPGTDDWAAQNARNASASLSLSSARVSGTPAAGARGRAGAGGFVGALEFSWSGFMGPPRGSGR